MALFKIEKKMETVCNIDCYPVDVSSVDKLYEFYKNIKHNMIPSEQMMSMCFFKKNYYYNIIKDYLFIYELNEKKNVRGLVGIPFNKDGEMIGVNTLQNYMRKKNLTFVSNATEDFITENPSVKKFFKMKKLDVGLEYVYDNELLSKLEGGTFANLRGKVNKFKNKNFSINIVPYQDHMFDDAMAVYDEWVKTFGQKYKKVWDKSFFTDSLKYCEELKHIVWIAYDVSESKKKPVGIVSYMRINENLVYGMHRKLSTEYQYFGQYMQYFQALRLMELGVRYLNDGDDGDTQGLRELKQGFRPICQFYTYEMELKEA